MQKCRAGQPLSGARGEVGRRGAGRDLLVLPQDFAAFAHALDGATPRGPGLNVAEILSADGAEALASAQVHLPALRRALERYLVFGGLPAAMAEAATGQTEPSEETQRVLWDSLVKEAQKRGASIPAVEALLERIMRSLGSKLSWSRLAREMDVPLGRPRRRPAGGHADPRTVQSYVELLAVNYFALVLYFWKRDSGSGDMAKDKKVYFGDPLLQTIVSGRIGLPRNPHAEVENALALALYRRTSRASAVPRTCRRPSGCTSGARAAEGRSTSYAARARRSTRSR